MIVEERCDVLDENGNPTGEVLPRSVIHERELLHGISYVWIYNQRGEVLLQKRAPDRKSFPGVWDMSAAGHISTGVTPLEAAVREVEEEVGLSVTPDDLTFITRTRDVGLTLPDKKHPIFCWVYILQQEFDLAELKIQESEVTDIKVMKLHNLERAIVQPGHEKIFADRTREIYEPAFAEIKKRLTEVKA